MTTENTVPFADLQEETRQIWDQNAFFWDDKMRDGNAFQSLRGWPNNGSCASRGSSFSVHHQQQASAAGLTSREQTACNMTEERGN